MNKEILKVKYSGNDMYADFKCTCPSNYFKDNPQLAEKLLEQVYLDIGSYNIRGVSFETSKKINDHFKFDD